MKGLSEEFKKCYTENYRTKDEVDEEKTQKFYSKLLAKFAQAFSQGETSVDISLGFQRTYKSRAIEKLKEIEGIVIEFRKVADETNHIMRFCTITYKP